MNDPAPAPASWKEQVPPGEEESFRRLAEEMGAMQRQLAQAKTIRRALHAKTNLVARASFEVRDDVPVPLRVGLFAAPGRYDAVVRFSNGSPQIQPDRNPDVRGIGVKIFGVKGPKALAELPHETQDFLGILAPTMPFRTPEEFVWFAVNARNRLTLLPKALLRFGFGRTKEIIAAVQSGFARKRLALEDNRYFSTLPIRFGDFATKFAFTPENAGGGEAEEDGGAQLRRTLGQRQVSWRFEVQLFRDEASTPIEDPMVEWTTDWTPLGRLVIPRQEISEAFAAWAEPLAFDPWHALEVFRPLGAMMRARKAAYYTSETVRGAAPEPTGLPG